VAGDREASSVELLSRARAGDTSAFANLVRRYERTVFSLALRMLSDRHDAEDLSQDVFIRLYRQGPKVESDAHLGFWLRKVTANLAIDRLRRDRRIAASPLSDAPEDAVGPGSPDPVLNRRLLGLVTELAPAARAVLLLRYQEDMDPADIALALDMPVNTVKSHLKRALATLRERLGPAVGDSGDHLGALAP
jgi:RNA polymerase sigma-70 factor, ECF subfamily